MINPFKGMPKYNPFNDWSTYIAFLLSMIIFKVVWFFTGNESTATYALISALFLSWFFPQSKIRS